MVFRIELTYNEIEKITDTKSINESTKDFTLEVGILEITNINLMLKSLLPEEVKVN